MKKDGLNFEKNTSMRQKDNSLNLSSLLNRSKKPEQQSSLGKSFISNR